MVARSAAFLAALFAVAQAAPQSIDVVSDVAVTGPQIQIRPKQTFQEYDGILVSEAFQRSLVLHELNTKSQNLALDLLFSNQTGAGFTILRNGLGSSPDDGWDLMKSIAPVAPASNSSKLNFIPLPRHDEWQVWLSKQAISRGVKQIWADSWSADGYMKTTGTDFNGGYLCGVTNATCATGDWRQAYADKIVKYIQDYEKAGIHISYVNAWNEPDLNTSYASMQSNGRQAADFIEVLYPTIKAAGLTTEIACCDASGWEQQRERLTDIQAAGAEKYLGIITAHGYSSPLGAPFDTDLKVAETEYSSFDPVNFGWNTGARGSQGLTWANRIMNGFANSNVTVFGYWWGAANTTDNQSLLIVNNTNTVQVTKRLWAFAHFGSRLVLPGARRISATPMAVTGINVTAFANPDGTFATQIINNGNTSQTITVTGLTVPNRQNAVSGYLTNAAKDFDEVVPVSQDRNRIVVNVPAFSLMSLRIAARNK